MTNPTAPATADSSSSSTAAASQQMTDQQAADAGRQLAYAVAAECDDSQAVNAEISKALDSAGPDSFAAVAGNAAATLATEIVAGLLAKADKAGMTRMRSDLLVAAASVLPDTTTSSGSAA